jgi:hypothetical protein
MLWEERNRKAMEERQLCIPGTDDAFMVGLAEDTPAHLEKPGSRWVLIHAKSGFRLNAFNVIKGWTVGQVSFIANWMYRQFPKTHWVWTETNTEKIKMCLEPLAQQGLNTRDWSGYQNARRCEIQDEMARLLLLGLDYGISDHPDEEESEDIRTTSRLVREENKKKGYPEPGFGYGDCPNADEELLELRVAYAKQKYVRP